MISLLLIFLLCGFLAGLLCLGGVALGGLLVFKTKKESHEQLFSFKKPQGGAFVVDPFEEEQTGEPQGKGHTFLSGLQHQPDDAATKLLDEQTERFLEQYQMQKVITEKKESEGVK
jgi:hypothetical protein